MLTSYEHYALTEMLGAPDSPPRHNGHLCFGQAWERQAFGMALALSKAGFFEWDVFRDELIAAIQAWEQSHQLRRSVLGLLRMLACGVGKGGARGGIDHAGRTRRALRRGGAAGPWWIEG